MWLMRRFIAVSALLAVVFCVGGCDFVRKVAGRPTSAEIQAMKIETEQRDTVVEEIILESLVPEEIPDVPVRDWSNLVSAELPCGYYILVGVFSNATNASNQAAYACRCGYEPTLIPFTNGNTGVGVCGGDYAAAASCFEAVKSQPFCPKDAFVLKIR